MIYCNGSISLSPLYPSSTINLHVRIATDLHQSFPWLRPTQAQFTIFRVPACILKLKPFTQRIMVGRQCKNLTSVQENLYINYAQGDELRALAHMLDSLVRVSRRGDKNYFVTFYPNHNTRTPIQVIHISYNPNKAQQQYYK